MPLELYAEGGNVRLVMLAIHELNSAWEATEIRS